MEIGVIMVIVYFAITLVLAVIAIAPFAVAWFLRFSDRYDSYYEATEDLRKADQEKQMQPRKIKES